MIFLAALLALEVSVNLTSINFMVAKWHNERKPLGDSRKDVYSMEVKSLDRVICIHFSCNRLDTVASSIS